MDDARFNRLVTLIFAVLGVLDIAVGAAFALCGDYFGIDGIVSVIAGWLFMAMGLGMLAFIVLRRNGPRGRG